MAAALKDVLVGVLIVLSLALAVIGWLSYSRTGNPKIRLVTVAFLLFLLKGIMSRPWCIPSGRINPSRLQI